MKIIMVLFGLFILAECKSQVKQIETEEQIWLGYFNQTRFSKRWGMWTDINARTKENLVNNLSLAMMRSGITYYINDEVKLTAGYAFINFFPSDNHKNISLPEHRPWQQIQWHTKYPKLKLMQWLRLEQRFRRKIKNDNELAEGYNFNYRIRYNILSQIPLSKKRFEPGTFSFVLADEVHVNMGKQIVYNYFDQNRFFAGIHYHVNKLDNLQFGYMNVFQQLASGKNFKSFHTARIFYFHSLDWRKRD